MSIKKKLSDLVPNTADKADFNSALACCGDFQRPGLALDFDLYVNYANAETTEDQLRIETALESILKPDSRVLHIGVGNSKLAKKLCARGLTVDGMTVSLAEQEYADSLKLKNYNVIIANKYHRKFTEYFDNNQFDIIVDNNLAAFACCQYHFYLMMENYLSCLKPGGKILTDQRGMDWALLDKKFIIDFNDLSSILVHHPVNVSKVTEMVYAIELISSYPDKQSDNLCVYARRHKNGKQYIESFSPASD